MAPTNLLQNPDPTYRKFVDNQVLTDNQLNDMLNHLEYQDKLSRVILSGVGIVCGLELSRKKENGDIIISEGAAVTTDGDLIKIEEKTFTGFKEFSDSRVKYSPFWEDNSLSVNLWQLEPTVEPSDVKSLSAFESTAGFTIDSAIFLIYLEHYVKDPEDCSPVDCDTQGKEVVNNVRVLMVSKEDVKTISQSDSIFKALLDDNQNTILDQLGPMYANRDIISSLDQFSYTHYKSTYSGICDFNKIGSVLTQLQKTNLLKQSIEQTQYQNALEKLDSVYFNHHNIQYNYDFYCDLTEAYNELYELIKENYALCCPDTKAFSKHILLGSVEQAPGLWRHRFYPSPILNYPDAKERIQNAYRRLIQMINNFREDYSNLPIKITPSRSGDYPLAKRAIPFYYFPDEPETWEKLFQTWKEHSREYLPNYYRSDPDGIGINPMDIRLKGHDFYRIEGHVGEDIQTAQKSIHKKKKDNGLSFDIMPIAIGGNPDEETINYDDYQVQFEDLQVVLQAWNEEQKCLMKKATGFLSGFSIASQGAHIGYISQEAVANNTADNSNTISYFSNYQPIYYEPQTYTVQAKKNYVLDGIEKEDNTLGSAMLQKINTSDNKNDIWVKTHSYLSNMIQDWNVDIIEATIKIPGQLIGYLKETEDNKLTNIDDFTGENLQKYINSLQEQCDKTKNSKKRLQNLINKSDSQLASQNWLEQYMFILNRLASACCLIEKVQVLYKEILQRKQEILRQLAIDNFIQDHPGATHQAGVSEGGTFVLLYYSSNSQVPFPSDFPHLAANIDPGYRMLSEPASTSLSNVNIPNLGTLGGQLERFRFVENIPHGTVIGDLSLPYICCSKIPSNTFIFPKQPASLRLPVGFVCKQLEQQADQILMNVTPSGGNVKASIGDRQLQGVIIQNDSGTFFDPNKVGVSDYGKTIRFTVNDQIVNPTLVIYQKPVAKFHINDITDKSFNQDRTRATVTFTNDTTPHEDVSFEWDFGDGSKETQNAITFTHIYDVKPGTTFNFEVHLVASNGPCENSISQQIKVDVPAVEEPMAECRDRAQKWIKASYDNIRSEYEANTDVLSPFNSDYSQIVKPDYEHITSNIDGALKGDMDDKIFLDIQNVQFNINNYLDNAESNQEQRKFAIKLYFELLLLYFYLQACRGDESIKVDAGISDVEPGWVDFATKAAEKYIKALLDLFEEDDIVNKLKEVQKNMGDRMVDRLQTDIRRIIGILSDA